MATDQKTLEERLKHAGMNISFGMNDALDKLMDRLYGYTKGIMRVEFVKDHLLGTCKMILRTPEETVELYATGSIKLIKNQLSSIWLVDTNRVLFFFIEDLVGKPMSELSFGHITLESEQL